MSPIGPFAALNRSLLSERDQALFDWFTERLVKDPMLYSSLLQGFCCAQPEVKYWDAVAEIKELVERPDFGKIVATANALVDKNKVEH